MPSIAANRMSNFKSNERGAVAIIFALSAVVVTLVTGLAVDTGRVYQSQSRIAAAVDAAALATAKALRERTTTSNNATDVARRSFDANMAVGHSDATIMSFNVNVDSRTRAVTVDVVADVPMTFAQVAGIAKMTVPSTATAIYDGRDLEIALQLDVTGSMCDPCSKIAALKESVSELLDILIPDGGTTNKVRVGLAPFAGGVNAGEYAPLVSNGRAMNGCVYERFNVAEQATDGPGQGLGALRARSDLTPAMWPYFIQDCPTNAKIVPMTDDKGLLRRTIDSWIADGGTAGHLGTAWAWYLISPKWASLWPSSAKPADYGTKNTMKVAILMTDGMYNTVGGWGNDDFLPGVAVSNKFAQDTCTAMKANGITVYTIGFQAPFGAKAALQACASSSSKFYDVTDESKLREAYRDIAIELNNLRLTR